MVVVFMDGKFLGDDTDLLKFVASKYKLFILKDFENIGKQALIEHLTKHSELGVNIIKVSEFWFSHTIIASKNNFDS